MVTTLVRLALLLTLALALVPAAHAQKSQASGQLPTHGIFVAGVSLAGVHLGYSQTQVTNTLGKGYIVCDPKMMALCKEPVWLFEYTHGEPLGVAVKFHNLKVSAIFTLGVIAGWKTKEGLKMGDPVSSIYNFYQTPLYTKCLGFEAFSARSGTVTTSIYTAGGIVYGFALTAKGESVCQ